MAKLELYNYTVKFTRIQGRCKASRTAMYPCGKLFQLGSSADHVRKLLLTVEIRSNGLITVPSGRHFDERKCRI